MGSLSHAFAAAGGEETNLESVKQATDLFDTDSLWVVFEFELGSLLNCVKEEIAVLIAAVMEMPLPLISNWRSLRFDAPMLFSKGIRCRSARARNIRAFTAEVEIPRICAVSLIQCSCNWRTSTTLLVRVRSPETAALTICLRSRRS